MPEIELLPVLVSTAALFVIGSTYYAVVPAELLAASAADADAGQPPPWKLAIELGRCVVLALVVAGIASEANIDGIAGGLALGAALWIGFPAVLWSGAILWEGTSPKLALLHGGDWLVKLLVAGVIVSVV